MSVDSDSAGELPAVSVIIPTFERRDLVRRAVRSVLAQRFREFEVIVVDGGSSDGTAEALAGVDPRLSFVCEPRPTVGAARNVGLRLARAPLIAFLDSDDRWLPDHLETLTAVLARHPEAVLVTSCRNYLTAGRQCPEEARIVGFPDRHITMGLVGFPSCVLVRRDALVAVGGFDEGLRVGEDTDLWVRLVYHGPFCVLRRRTVRVQHTRGGLKQRGLRSGAYLETRERIARRAVEQEQVHATLEGRKLAHEGRETLAMLAALRPLQRGDEDGLGTALQNACGDFPELSRHSSLVATLIDRLPAKTNRERLHHFITVLDRWPAPHAPTALYLRARAVMLAFRMGRGVEALRLLRGWPLQPTPRFVRSMLPLLVRNARLRLQELKHRGRETNSFAAAQLSHGDEAGTRWATRETLPR